MTTRGDLEVYIAAWWGLFAVALFMLLPLDLLTTLFAVAEYGVAVEANPIMRWLLGHGLVAVTVANLVAAGAVIYLFHIAVGKFRETSSSGRRVLVPVVSAWIIVLNVAGITIVLNNLAVWL